MENSDNPVTNTSIAVGVTPEAVHAIRSKNKSDSTLLALRRVLNKFNLEYREENWDSKEIETAVYLYIDINSQQNSNDIIRELMELPFIESAFLKTEGELPF